MEIQLIRKYKNETNTIGELHIGDKSFFVLEDKDRGLKSDMELSLIKSTKVFGNTCIPYGRYQVKYTMSPRMKKFTLEIIGVKGFSGIRIHSGNTEKDSLGCLLPGMTTDKKTKVSDSRTAVKKIEEILLPILQKEDVFIVISGN